MYIFNKRNCVLTLLAFGQGVLCVSVTQARLVYSTEEDGVHTPAFYLNQDDTSDDFVDLNFGTSSGAQLRYDVINDDLTFNRSIDLNGNEIKNFEIERLAVAPTCDGTAIGRMYFNTASSQTFICDGTTFNVLENTGFLTTVDISDDTNLAVGTGITLTDDTLSVDLGTDIQTGEIGDNEVTLAKVADGGADQVLTTDGTGNPQWENKSNFATSAQGTLADSALQSGDNVSALTNDAGYLTAEVDASITNELQDLDLVGNTLSLTDDGTTVDLSGFANTDSQALNLTGDDLTISGGAGTIDLSGYVNTDTTYTGSGGVVLTGTDFTASLGTSVGIAEMDNGGNNQVLTTTGAGVPQWENKSNFATAAQGTLADSALQSGDNVSALTNDAGYLTAEVDASITNEIQDLDLVGNTLSLTDDGTTVDLAGYLDNTDTQALNLTGDDLTISGGAGTIDLSGYTNTDELSGLSCGVNEIAKWNGSAWACAADAGGTSYTGGTGITLTGTVFSNDLGTDIGITEIANGGNNQVLTTTGAGVPQWENKSNFATAAQGTLADSALQSGDNVSALTNDAGYLTAEVDASITNEIQDLDLVGNTLSLTDDGTTVDLSGFANTDAQDLSLAVNTLSLTNDGTTVDLSGYLDNTDTQALNLTGDDLTISGGAGTIDLSGYANTDAQDLALAGDTLSLTNDGTTVDLAGYLDNTDAQDLSLAVNTLSLTNDGTTVDLAGYLDNTDTQALNLTGDDLTISGGAGTIDLSGYANTDAQDLALAGDTLSLTNDGTTVDLAGYLDNTDAQDLSLAVNTLSLTNDGTTVDLAGYLDNTDTQALNLTGDDLTISGGAGTIDLSGYVNTDTTYSAGTGMNLVGTTFSTTLGTDIGIGEIANGGNDQVLTTTGAGVAQWENKSNFATSAQGTLADSALQAEVDGSITNELQDLDLVGNTLSLTDDGTTVDLSGFANTDSQDLSLAVNTLSLTNDGTTVDLAGYLDNTDTQALNLTGDDLTISGGAGTIDLSGYANTDAQDLDLTVNTLSLTNDGSTVDLAGYLDNTDTQALNLTGDDLTISGGAGTIDLSGYANTDAQDLDLTVNTLSLTNDGSTVDLAGYLDNTDAQALNLTGDDLTISGGAGTIDLSGYANTDAQDLDLTVNTLSLTNDGSTVDLAGYLDNTDTQALNLTGDDLTISGGAGTIDLSGYVNTDTTYTGGTGITLTGTVFSNDLGTDIGIAEIANGGNNQVLTTTGAGVPQWEDKTVFATSAQGTLADSALQSGDNVSALTNDAGYLTAEVDASITNEIQDLDLVGNTLSLTDDGTTVDLAGYLDNTDTQALNLTGDDLTISGGAGTVDLSGYANTDAQDLSLAVNTLSLTNDGTTVDLAGYLDNTDAQDLSLAVNTLSLTNDGSTVDLAGYLDNTDAQALNLTGDDLTISGGAGTIDLSGYANTDAQDLDLTVNTLSLTNDGTTVDLAGYLDNTDAQDLSLAVNTLSLTNDGTTVDLAGYLDNTDTQALNLTGDDLTISGGAGTIDLSGYANTDTTYTGGTGITLTGTVFSNDLGTDIGIAELANGGNNQVLTTTGAGVPQWENKTNFATSAQGTLADSALQSGDNVSALTNDAGYLTAEVDASITNEIQDLDLVGNTLSLTDDGTTVDLAGYLDNTDTQALNLTGDDLTISGGAGTIDLSGYANTDTTYTGGTGITLTGTVFSNDLGTDIGIAELANGGNNQVLTTTGAGVPQWENKTNFATSAQGTLADSALQAEVDGSITNELQDLSLTVNTLALTDDGTTVDLSGYLDNTDTQALNLTGDDLTISGGAGTIDLSGYANTDAQDLTLAVNTLSLTNDGTTVDLAGYLDNTDELAGLSCALNEIVKWNGSAWACAPDAGGTAYTGSGGITLTGSNFTADLGSDIQTGEIGDNEVTLAKVADGGANQVLTTDGTGNPQWENKSNFATAAQGTLADSALQAEVDGSITNELQDLDLVGNTLSLTDDGTTVDLAGYLDNTDTQALNLTGDDLTISGGAGTIDLSGYANTDAQDLDLTVNTLSLTNDGSTVDLAGYLDNTDTQALNLTGDDLTISGGAGTIDLSGYVNTDTTYTGSGGVTLGGTNFTADLGTSIETAEIGDNEVTLSKIADGGANQVLTTDGSNNPQWEDKSNFLTSTLAASNILVGNGSGVATAVNPAGDVEIASDGTTTIEDNSVDGTDIAIGGDTAGDTMYYNGTDWVRLAIGTAGQVLQTNPGVTAPEWNDSTGIKYQSIDIFGCVRGSASSGTVASGNSAVVRFDAGGNSQMRCSFAVPSDWQAGTDINIETYYSPSDNTAGDVRFNLRHAAKAVGETIAGGDFVDTVSAAVTIAATTQLQMYEMVEDIPSAGIAADDMININLRRTPGDASDTYTGDINIHMLRIAYTGKELQ